MSLYRHMAAVPAVPGALADWAEIPAAVASDCLNRGQAMAGRISPLDPAMRVIGRARTVRCKVGDNGPIHAAISLVERGDVLVVDAGGHPDTAVFGGLMARDATARGLGGLVIDGAVRDRSEIIALGLPVWAVGAVPEGPHKGFGGSVDGPVSCGGVSVAPGDLVIGDGDGVTIVPHAVIAETLKAAHALLAKEAKALDAIASGEGLAGLYGVPAITEVP